MEFKLVVLPKYFPEKIGVNITTAIREAKKLDRMNYMQVINDMPEIIPAADFPGIEYAFEIEDAIEHSFLFTDSNTYTEEPDREDVFALSLSYGIKKEIIISNKPLNPETISRRLIQKVKKRLGIKSIVPKTKEEIENDLIVKQRKFYDELVPFLPEYGKEMIREFYDYWSTPIRSGGVMLKDSSHVKTKFDIAKRLARWARNGYNTNMGSNKNEEIIKDVAAEKLQEKIRGKRD